MRARHWRVALLLAALTGGVPAQAAEDGLAEALTATPGDAQRGLAIAASRQGGLCVLCHAVPGAAGLQGDIGPDLAGVGARLTPAQLRLRIVDSRRVQPQTVMPPYHLDAQDRAALQDVAPAWRDLPILLAQDVEDVVAYLVSLR